MNILYASATYAPFLGGAETYLRAMTSRMVAANHCVWAATTDAAEVEAFWNPRKRTVAALSETIAGVQVRRARIRHTPFSPLSFYVYRRVAVELSRLPGAALFLRPLAHFMPWAPGYGRLLNQIQQPFDLVHGINIALEWPLIAAWRYARHRRLPFVATPFVHVGEPGSSLVARNYTMPHQIEALAGADAVIVQTRIEGDHLLGFGLDPQRIHVAGMGIDPQDYHSGDSAHFRARYGIPAQEPIALFMGVITRDKGIVHLVQAMRSLWDQGGSAWLVIAGNPTEEFESFWAGLPASVTRRIIRTGVVTGADKQDAFAAADIFVLPSRIDSFGIVILEAWAYGLPVVGARAGGIPSVIDEGQDGYIAPYGDVPALAQLIDKLLRDASLRRELGSRGKAKMLGRYTWDLIFQQHQRIYQSVLSNPRWAKNARTGN